MHETLLLKIISFLDFLHLMQIRTAPNLGNYLVFVASCELVGLALKRIIEIFLLVSTVPGLSILSAQDNVVHNSQSFSLKTHFAQIKDEFNYGLVFYGMNLNLGYSFISTSDGKTFSYTPELGFGANFNKGVGAALLFQPIDLFYGLNVNESIIRPLTIGPYFSTNYKWQMYPELQSGKMFWFTSLEAGPRFMATIPFRNKLFKVVVANSIAGWTSRPQPATETTFYSREFSDFVRNAHSDLKFGSYNLFNHTNMEIEWINAKDKKLSASYEFEYVGYYKNPDFSYVVHALNLTWKIGKKKQNRI